MRKHVSTFWPVVYTSFLLIFTAYIVPYRNLLSASSSVVATGTPSKPGCVFGITHDVNGCGVWAFFTCSPIGSYSPGPYHNRQCVICRIWQFQIQGQQQHFKVWRDCNGDGIADCEFWYGWAIPKGCIIVTTSVGVECVCE